LRISDAISASHTRHPLLAAAGACVYLTLSGLCLLSWRRSHSQKENWAWLWGFLAAGNLFFAVDAVFGIRLLIAEIGREIFKDHGWYAARRSFQGLASAVVLLALGLIAWGALRAARRVPPGCRLALAGLALSAIPFVIACISMHFMEDLMARPNAVLGLGAALRAAGCAVTGIGAWHFCARRRPVISK